MRLHAAYSVFLSLIASTLPLSASAGTAAFTDPAGGQHFIWVDTNQHIQQLYWNGQAYGEQDLTAAAGAVSVMVGTGIGAFVDPSSSAQHFVFIGSDQHLHQIFFWNQAWGGTDFTNETGAPVPATGSGTATFIDPAGGQHFVWVDTNQHIQQLYWNGQAYGEQDLTAAAGAVSVMVGTGISAFVDPSNSAQHFVFVGSDQHLHQIFLWNQAWGGTDFTNETGAPVPATGSGTATFIDPAGGQHFVWVDTNQHIQQLYWNGQAYGEQDLTAAAGAVSVMVGTGISAFVDPSSSAQHFVFIGSDQHVHQIVWNQTWSGTDFTAATAAPVPAGGALSIGGQQSGSQLPIFAPQSTTTLYAACNDQDGPIPYCNLTLQAGYYDNTNGHTHTNMQAPLSEISPGSGRSDGSGNLVVTLTTTRVGHQETIYECDTDHNICSVNDYLVGFSGLVLVNGSAQAILVGATPYHGNDNYYNHWMTTNALVGLSDTISAFLGAHPGQGQVALNDMALPYGGVFDLNRNWTSPHVSHDFGTAADVRGNTAQAAIPVSLQEQYRQTCLQNGAIDARIEYATPGDTDGYVQDPRRHIHCRWAY